MFHSSTSVSYQTISDLVGISSSFLKKGNKINECFIKCLEKNTWSWVVCYQLLHGVHCSTPESNFMYTKHSLCQPCRQNFSLHAFLSFGQLCTDTHQQALKLLCIFMYIALRNHSREKHWTRTQRGNLQRPAIQYMPLSIIGCSWYL